MMTFDCINLKSTPHLTILQFQCRHVAWLDLTFLSLARPQCRPGFSLAFYHFQIFVSACYKVCRYFAPLVPFLMFLSYRVSRSIDAFDGVE